MTARIVLSPSPKADSGFLPLTPSRTVLCKQQRPNRNHHCTIAIPNAETTVTDLSALPCPPDACYVNLIVGASNKKAKGGDVVVLGADRPDASVAQDKGRANLVQAHGNVPAPSSTSTEDLVNTELPLTVDDSEKRRSVYSIPISSPQKGEVLAFDSSFTTDINALRFNTFISSRVIVGTDPTATKSTGIAKNAIPLKGQATESNGFNCTLGRSGYANPCATVKAGAVRFQRDVVDQATGAPATVYLNVLARRQAAARGEGRQRGQGGARLPAGRPHGAALLALGEGRPSLWARGDVTSRTALGAALGRRGRLVGAVGGRGRLGGSGGVARFGVRIDRARVLLVRVRGRTLALRGLRALLRFGGLATRARRLLVGRRRFLFRGQSARGRLLAVLGCDLAAVVGPDLRSAT